MNKAYDIVKLTTDIFMDVHKLRESRIEPTLIVITPVDYLMLRESCGWLFDNEVKRTFCGIEVIRSGDLEVGTFLIK